MTTAGRKRQRHRRGELESRKKARIDSGDAVNDTKVEHPTLRRYYRQISTLRNYLISTLPDHAKLRRRKIKTAGVSEDESFQIRRITRREPGGTAPASSCRPDELARVSGHGQARLAALLDHTLVCTPESSISPFKASREKDFIKFSQQAEISLGSTLDGGTTSISDVSIAEIPSAHAIPSPFSRPFGGETWNANPSSNNSPLLAE